MTKKFISLVLSLVLVIGLIPSFSVLAATSAESVIYVDDDFENWTVKDFSETFSYGTQGTAYNTGDSTSYSDAWYVRKNILFKITEMPGLDGEMTNVAEITANSAAYSGSGSSTPGTARFEIRPTPTFPTSGIVVQELDVYIDDNTFNHAYLRPFYIRYGEIGIVQDAGNDIYKTVPVSNGWHNVVSVVTMGGDGPNAICYVDGECISYNELTTSVASLIQVYGKNQPGFKSLKFDNIKMYSDPNETTVSSVYSDASNVSKTVSPVVTFSERVFEYSSHSDGISLEDVELIATSGATPVGIDISLSNDGKTLTIDPEENLDPGTEYTVKLTGLVDMYGQAIADTEFSFTTMEESKISCAQPTFKKENLFVYGNQGTTITTLENGYIRTDLTVSNSDTADKEVCVIALLKEDGDIKGFQFDEITVPASDSVDFNCSFQIDDAANQTIETFVWDSFSGKAPLASKWTFTSSGCTETVIEEQ